VALLGFALARTGGERIFGVNALVFGALCFGLGFLFYFLMARFSQTRDQQ
jgi:Zn-dependent protease with chaperone function